MPTKTYDDGTRVTWGFVEVSKEIFYKVMGTHKGHFVPETYDDDLKFRFNDCTLGTIRDYRNSSKVKYYLFEDLLLGTIC